MIPSDKAKALPRHSRRLELPNSKGWLEVRGEFNLFDLDTDQRELLGKIADWFYEFDRRSSGTNTEDEKGKTQ